MKFPLWSLPVAHGRQRILLSACLAIFFLAATAPSENTLKILSGSWLALQQKVSALIYFQ
jgi:hypothetical protein